MSRPCTSDTGGLDDVFVGAPVTWLHIPRGGYGYICPVEARVLSYSLRPSTKVRIEVVRLRDGAKVVRTVDVSTLRWGTR